MDPFMFYPTVKDIDASVLGQLEFESEVNIVDVLAGHSGKKGRDRPNGWDGRGGGKEDRGPGEG